jgi:hypothetical protein
MAHIRLKYVNAFANNARKGGRVRYYFRRHGQRAIPLPGLPGSEEFMAAYAMALAAIPEYAQQIGAGRTSPGTINALAVDYYRSQQWQDLAADTRRKRWRIIERFRAHHGDKRVALLRQEHIQIMLAAIPKPSVKRDWFKAIRGLLRYAVPTMLKIDPTEGIATIKLPKSKGHHTWTDDEIQRYRAHWPLGTQQRSSWSSRWRPPPAKARLFASAHSMSAMAGSVSSELTAARMLTSRYRRSCKPRATQCRNRILPTSSRYTVSRARNTASATTSPDGQPPPAYRHAVAYMDSRKAPCGVWPRLAIPRTS